MTDHLEKSAAAVMILVVGLEMLGQVVDPVGKDRDLYLGEPVSPSWVAYCSIMLFLISAVMMFSPHKNN